MDTNYATNKLMFARGDNAGRVVDDGTHIVRIPYEESANRPGKIFSFYSKYALQHFGVVKTEFIAKDNILKHEKLLITYPHEWPPALFKDAVLFHLYLLLQLSRYGLTLKDALPENILFSGVTPNFVDFFSLLPANELTNEEWLRTGCSDGTDLRMQILERMFVPYMLIPLLLYANGSYTEGRNLLEHYFCNNCSNEVSGWPLLQASSSSYIRKILRAFRKPEAFILDSQIYAIRRLCTNASELSWEQLIQYLIRHIETLHIMPPASGYINYYAAKGEDAGLCDPESWNDKQCSVAKLLAAYSPKSVLDIGANTGWFSLLAAQSGARVIALDLDLPSIDALYRTVKGTFPSSVTPLWMSFDDLKMEGFSLDAEGKQQDHPFHMAATKRLCSDMVLCLGLLHHLTLGMGKGLEDILETLFSLTNKILILEFVDIDDPLILGDPGFFPAIAQWDRASYSQEKIKNMATRFGYNVFVRPSTPSSTRHLLVFEK